MPVSAFGGVSAYAKLGGTRSEAAPERALAREGGERGTGGIGEPLDEVELSPEALSRGEEQEDAAGLLTGGRAEDDGRPGATGSETRANASSGEAEDLTEETDAVAEGEDETPADSNELTEADKDVVRQLKERDAEVRRHENAHASVGGQYAGSPQYEFQTGPDGKRYAVGGSVSIDVSPVPGEPEKTIEKMRIVRAAALAPAEPSGQDRRVAAEATKMEASARSELAEQKAAEASEPDETTETGETAETAETATTTETTAAAESAANGPVESSTPTPSPSRPSAGAGPVSAGPGAVTEAGPAEVPGRAGPVSDGFRPTGDGSDTAASVITAGVQASGVAAPDAGPGASAVDGGPGVSSAVGADGSAATENDRNAGPGAGTMQLAAARRAAGQYGQQAARAAQTVSSPGSLLQATA